jgi:GTP-binding protein
MRVESGKPPTSSWSRPRRAQLGILIENMRREGFELSVGKPEVIIKEIDGVDHEPIEELVIDVPNEPSAPVMELVGRAQGRDEEDGAPRRHRHAT